MYALVLVFAEHHIAAELVSGAVEALEGVLEALREEAGQLRGAVFPVHLVFQPLLHNLLHHALHLAALELLLRAWGQLVRVLKGQGGYPAGGLLAGREDTASAYLEALLGAPAQHGGAAPRARRQLLHQRPHRLVAATAGRAPGLQVGGVSAAGG